MFMRMIYGEKLAQAAYLQRAGYDVVNLAGGIGACEYNAATIEN